MVDIKNKICEFDGCTTRVLYGKPGTIITRCYKHREIGMIKRSLNKCKTCKKEIASYGNLISAERCEEHKLDTDYNMLERECRSCKLPCILNKDELCEVCCPINFNIVRLAKQNALFQYLDGINLNGTSSDKIVYDTICGKERPDRVYEMDDFVLILECDEHQHKDRQCVCEQTRMINIGQGYGGLRIYFIRWNPDNYKPGIGYTEEENINKKHKLVGNLIKSILTKRTKLPTNGFIYAMYLYYDGWTCLGDEKWNMVMEYDM